MNVTNTDLLSGNSENPSAQEDAPSPALALSAALGTHGDAAIPPKLTSPSDEEHSEVPAAVRQLPVLLDIRVPLASFRVRDLVALTGGMVLETEWPASEDVPLGSGSVRLVWAEFEVMDQRLAARITGLA